MDHSAFLQTLLSWLNAHPAWGNVIVFLVTFIDCLIVVGLFIPASSLLVLALGGLVSLGALELGETLFWAMAGALSGDLFSFWVGYHYHNHLRRLWPFSRYPQWLERGESFCQQHGGKSIFLGHFLGPTRPIVPAVTGMLGMPPWRFVLNCSISVFLWAPTYILLGMVLGASLATAAEVSLRFLTFVLLLIALLWLTYFLINRIFCYFQPRITLMIRELLIWSRNHPTLGVGMKALIDPQYPESMGLLGWALLLIVTITLFSLLILNVFDASLPLPLDERVQLFFQSMTTTWGDPIVWAMMLPGEPMVSALVLLGGGAVLGARKAWAAITHWLIAFLLGIITAIVLHWLFSGRISLAMSSGFDDAFPSLYFTTLVILYGFLALLMAYEITGRYRVIPYIASAMFVTMMLISHLYWERCWFSNAVGGIAFGLIWVLLLGIAYRRHYHIHIPLKFVLPTLLSAVGIGVALLSYNNHSQKGLTHAGQRQSFEVLSQEDWWEKGWTKLSLFKIDLTGGDQYPLNLQYAGNLKKLEESLLEQGCYPVAAVTWGNFMHWFDMKEPISHLPVLPQTHNGHLESLRLICSFHQKGSHSEVSDIENNYLVRIWPTRTWLSGGQPLWVGSLTGLKKHHFKLIHFITSSDHYGVPQDFIEKSAKDFSWQMVNASSPQFRTFLLKE